MCRAAAYRTEAILESHRQGAGILELRRNYGGSFLIDEAPGIAYADCSQAIGEGRATVELRIDRDAAVLVNVARAIAYLDHGHAIRKRRRIDELRGNFQLSGTVYISDLAILMHEKQAA